MKSLCSTFALALCTILSLCIIVCCGGEPPITVTGKEGRVFSSYQEACAAQDFTAAHQYLAVLKNTADNYYVKGGKKNYHKYLNYLGLLNEGEEYVYKNEALYLMAMDDDDFITKRLVFLLKEAGDDGNDSRCDMIVDIAIDMDKEDIVKALTRMYKKNIPDAELKKIAEYLYVQKGDENLEFVKYLIFMNGKGILLMDAAIQKANVPLVVESAGFVTGSIDISDYKKVTEFLKTHDSKEYKRICALLAPKVDDRSEMLEYALATKQAFLVKQLIQDYGILNISDKAMITKLAAVNDNSLSDRIILALGEAGKDVPPMPSISGYIKSSHYGEMDEYTEHGKYNDAVKAFNAECMSILNIAVANKNLYLAKAAVSKMKKHLVFREVGDWVRVVEKETTHSSVYNAFVASTSSEDINLAQRELNEAISKGYFR